MLQFATLNPNLSVLPCHDFASPLCTYNCMWEIKYYWNGVTENGIVFMPIL